ncbi:hypothetical protein SLS62_002497 [Diatrype stigma]|uniref:mannan endo-1,6-alpha-mannosidase n=1 Tax=Diatrype stigma TaxID=117547 RepID=A0AAN9UWL2_9PEZI
MSKLAEDTYDLLSDIGLIDEKFNVYSGAQAAGCDEIDKIQISLDAAMLLEGCAYQYSFTGDDDWKERIDGLLSRTLDVFFPDGVAVEAACEKSKTCNTDMEFYKGFLHRSLAKTMQLAPQTADTILPVLKSSAKAAVARCTGGDNGRMCGFSWVADEFDESSAGAQSSVLAALYSAMTTTTANSSSTGDGQTSGGNGTTDSNGTGSNTTDDSTADSMGARSGIHLGVALASLLFATIIDI